MKSDQRWTKAASAAAIFAVVAASSAAVHAQPVGAPQAGPKPAGQQPAGPQPAGPQPAGPDQAEPPQPGPEQAGPITPEASQKSDDLFKRGKEQYKDGKLKDAYASYRAAWDLKKSYDLAANLGNTELLLGLKRDAADHYAYCLRTFAATGGKERRDAAQKKFDEARKEVGALAIRVSAAGAEVLIDGNPVGRAPLKDEVYVDPGTRTVEARMLGYEPAKQIAQVEKGAPTQAITLTLVAKKVEPPPGSGKGDGGKGALGGPPPPIEPPPPPKKKNKGLIGAGVGLTVVMAGVGMVLMVASGNDAKDADTQLTDLTAKGGPYPCSTGRFTQDCGNLHQLRVDSDNTHNAAVGLFVSAGVVGVATLAYALWPMKREARPQQQQGLRVGPIFGAGTTGAVVSGRF